MRTSGNLLIFDYPGGQITFHKDLKKYYEVLTRFRAQADEVNKRIDIRTDPKWIANTVTNMATKFLQTNVLLSLSSYGIYDMTVSDFLSDNFALDELTKSANNMKEYERIIEQGLHSAANQAKANAADIASQEITGLGFGIISNSVIDHAIYAAQSASVLEKQTAEAQWKYNKVASIIETGVQKDIWDMKYENRKKNEKIINTTITIMFEIMADKYCKKLAEIGEINLVACWNGLDEGRSNELLNNIDYIPRKENVIFQAIQLCPYNINAYMLWFEQRLTFQSVHKEILDYFGSTNMVCQKIAQRCNNCAETMVDIYNQNQDIISAISVLKGQTTQQIAHDLLFPGFQDLLQLYKDLSQWIKMDILVDLLGAKYPNKPISLYETCLKNDLASVANVFTPSEIEFCLNSCNLDVYATLSLWFNRNITSFQNANNIIFDNLKANVSKFDASEMRRTSAERKREFENLLDSVAELINKKQEMEKNLTALNKSLFIHILVLILFPFIFVWAAKYTSDNYKYLSGGSVFIAFLLLGLMYCVSIFFVYLVFSTPKKIKRIDAEISNMKDRLKEIEN